MKDNVVLRQRVTRLLAERMALSVPSESADLVESGQLDSLSFVDLLHLLEREFGVHFTLDDLEIDHFRSVAKIAEFVAARTHPSAAAADTRLNGNRSALS
jgi:acyl carrier protein